MCMQEGQGRAPSAWDILKLVPNTLLGLPVSISSPSATAASLLPNSPHTSDDQGADHTLLLGTVHHACHDDWQSPVGWKRECSCSHTHSFQSQCFCALVVAIF